ncbi:MAG: acyltransferase, partial [Candidatus Neomarinimicrobiota bacterium]|nr:acyltransferase [Candidatus Neomarinimicrobiota bacterium]
MFQFLCKMLLKLINWQVEGTLPDAPQYIAIVGPHTSNWDFII